jgi:arabinose-5-phosphate isomerase
MAKGKEIPLVTSSKSIKIAVTEMSKKRLGVVCCKEKNGKISILTDGDLRRHSNNLFSKSILKVTSKNPTWISDSATALSAIEMMNSKKITTLLVARNQDINKKIKKVVGILHLHHCLSHGIK